MDKMAILAAPTTEPSVALRQRSNLLSILGPVIRLAPPFRDTVGSASYYIWVRSHFVVSLAVTSLLVASKAAIVTSFLIGRFLAFKSATLTKFLGLAAWNSKSCRRLKKKLEFEFFVLVLGPGGNALCLMIFWPGWIIAIAAVWAAWTWAGVN